MLMKTSLKQFQHCLQTLSPVSLHILKTGLMFCCISLIVSLIYCISNNSSSYANYLNILFSKSAFEGAILILAETISISLMVDAYLRKNDESNKNDESK